MFFCFHEYPSSCWQHPSSSLHQASNEPSMDLLSHQDEDITSSLALGFFLRGWMLWIGWASPSFPVCSPFFLHDMRLEETRRSYGTMIGDLCWPHIVCFAWEHFHILINFGFSSIQVVSACNYVSMTFYDLLECLLSNNMQVHIYIYIYIC